MGRTTSKTSHELRERKENSLSGFSGYRNVVIYTPNAENNFWKYPEIRERLEAALKYFPEVEKIKIGWTSRSPHYSVANSCIRLGKKCDIFSIAHELVHHLQYDHRALQQIPRGEKSCDVYAFSRSPELVGGRSHYVKMPREFLSDNLPLERRMVVCKTAREAIRRRNSGMRNYIKWFEEELTRRDSL